MRALLFLFAIHVIMPNSSAMAQTGSPALDCYDPKNVGQSAICSSERLFNLDRKLAENKNTNVTRKAIIAECNAGGEATLRAEDTWKTSDCLWHAFHKALNIAEPNIGDKSIVHPVCIDSLLPSMENPDSGKGQSIDLAACQIGSRHLPFDQPDVKNQVFYHHDRWGPEMHSGWIGYSDIGRIGKDALLSIYDNGGGTGTFSMLALVRGMPDETGGIKPGDRLELIYIWFFGDRCNGGLESSEITKTGDILVQAHVTTADLLWNAPQSLDGKWQPPEGIAYSAANCIGTVKYKIDPKNPDTHYQFLQARIDRIDDDKWTLDTFPQQECVNALLNRALDKIPGSLSLQQLSDLADQVTEECR